MNETNTPEPVEADPQLLGRFMAAGQEASKAVDQVIAQHYAASGIAPNLLNMQRGMELESRAREIDRQAEQMQTEINRLRGQAKRLRREAYQAFTDTQPNLFDAGGAGESDLPAPPSNDSTEEPGDDGLGWDTHPEKPTDPRFEKPGAFVLCCLFCDTEGNNLATETEAIAAGWSKINSIDDPASFDNDKAIHSHFGLCPKCKADGTGKLAEDLEAFTQSEEAGQGVLGMRHIQVWAHKTDEKIIIHAVKSSVGLGWRVGSSAIVGSAHGGVGLIRNETGYESEAYAIRTEAQRIRAWLKTMTKDSMKSQADKARRAIKAVETFIDHNPACRLPSQPAPAAKKIKKKGGRS